MAMTRLAVRKAMRFAQRASKRARIVL